jgi:hypothetical protein
MCDKNNHSDKQSVKKEDNTIVWQEKTPPGDYEDVAVRMDFFCCLTDDHYYCS